MADLTYIHFPGTQQTFLFSSLDIDPTVKAAAAALPDSTISIPDVTPTPVAAKMIIAGKALDIPGIYQVGGSTGGTTTVKPGAPETVTATLSGTDVTVRATAPLQVGTPAYAAIVVGLDGNVDPNPVISPTGEAVFAGLAPGVYTPWAYAFGNGGIGPTQYGAAVVIAGAGTPPAVTGNPTIQGVSTYGSNLVLTLPPATDAVSSRIYWTRDGVEIPGASSTSYRQAGVDMGKAIGARVVWTSADGSITQRTALAMSPTTKGTMVAVRAAPAINGTGEVGVPHPIDWGVPDAFEPYPEGTGGGSGSEAFYIDGVFVVGGTRGLSLDYQTWTPQAADAGKRAVARFSQVNSAYVFDAVFNSVAVTVIAPTGTQASVTVANTTPTTGATPGVKVQLADISGATADAGTSITITARTDAASTGGVGVWELTAADVTAYNAGTYSLPVGGMAMDIPPTLAQGTTITTGPFSSGTVALVFAPIGSGTYSYTLSLGTGAPQPTASDTGVFFDDGAGLYFDDGSGLFFDSP